MTTQTKPPPSEYSEKAETEFDDICWRNWLIQNALMPLEDSTRQSYTTRQIDHWTKWFREERWSQREIVRARKLLERECRFLPSAADWIRVRPKQYDDHRADAKPLPETLQGLARNAEPGSWQHFIASATQIGVKERDMVTAYDRIIAEGDNRGEPVHGFREARAKCIEIRQIRRGGNGQKQQAEGTQVSTAVAG